MRTIWKYQLEVSDEQVVSMPSGTGILTVQTQGGVPCLWAEVWSDLEPRNRTIRTIGTGHAIPDDEKLRYIGTYQLTEAGLVFHVFEKF